MNSTSISNIFNSMINIWNTIESGIIDWKNKKYINATLEFIDVLYYINPFWNGLYFGILQTIDIVQNSLIYKVRDKILVTLAKHGGYIVWDIMQIVK